MKIVEERKVTGWTIEDRFPEGAGNFFPHRVRNECWAYVASCFMDTGGFFSRVEAAGAWS
jgi:hypothetical protein